MIARIAALTLSVLLALPASAQTAVNFASVNVDRSAPVEVDASTLSVDQATGQAVFSGDVKVGQGNLRLAAQKIEVTYDKDGEITRLTASGGVTFATPSEEAESRNAVYDLTRGTLVLTGDVLVAQGATALSAERMEVNLTTGDATLSGRVRTIFGGQ